MLPEVVVGMCIPSPCLPSVSGKLWGMSSTPNAALHPRIWKGHSCLEQGSIIMPWSW